VRGVQRKRRWVRRSGRLHRVDQDPLRTSLAEQLTRMRGDDGALSDALLDIVRETLDPGGAGPLTLLRPRDWDELRHQEGALARTAPYWAQLWPSGLALADALAARDDLSGRRVLELGCGLGLPSVVAARAGARVLATDGVSDAVVFAAHNLAVNDVEGDVALVDWRAADALAERGPWDLVVAADVFYVRHNVDALLRLLPRLLEDGEALIVDPSRAGGRDFLAAARGVFAVDTRADPERERVNVHTLRRRGAVVRGD
jgi:predicted nicotinamide N-methyase